LRENITPPTKEGGPGVVPRKIYEKSAAKSQSCKQNVGVFSCLQS
jgi:hypothetical protein